MLCGCVNSLSTVAVYSFAKQLGAPQSADIQDMFKAVPGYLEVEFGKGVVVLVLGLFLLVAGIGLLNMKSWGRWLTLLCGVCMVLLQVSCLVYEVRVQMPAMEKWQQDYMVKQGMAAPPSNTFESMGDAVLGAMLPIAIALVCSALVLLPAMGAAFKGETKRIDEDEIGEEADDDYRFRGT
jgi:hypothetical protein